MRPSVIPLIFLACAPVPVYPIFLDSNGAFIESPEHRLMLAAWTRERYDRDMRDCVYGGLVLRSAPIADVEAYCASR